MPGSAARDPNWGPSSRRADSARLGMGQFATQGPRKMHRVQTPNVRVLGRREFRWLKAVPVAEEVSEAWLPENRKSWTGSWGHKAG